MKPLVAVTLLATIGMITSEKTSQDPDESFLALFKLFRWGARPDLPNMQFLTFNSSLKSEIKRLDEKCTPLVYNDKYRFYLGNPSKELPPKLKSIYEQVEKLIEERNFVEAAKIVNSYTEVTPTPLEMLVPKQTQYACGTYKCAVTSYGDKFGVDILCLFGPSGSFTEDDFATKLANARIDITTVTLLISSLFIIYLF
uniref:SCP domain-containing protein n=1 Tax=Caenorhabditis japonica TaxID=281687 RepID=A0A8R1HND8_CAEJA